MTPFTIGLLVFAVCLAAIAVMFFIACGGLRKAEREGQRRANPPR